MNNLEKITGQTMEELKEKQELIILEEDLKEFPKEICKLTNLTHLQVIGCNLTKLPKEIGKLTKLKNLVVNGNKLTSIPKEIGNLTNLIYLNLSNNPIAELPEEIEDLKYSLEELVLTNTNMTKEYVYLIIQPQLPFTTIIY